VVVKRYQLIHGAANPPPRSDVSDQALDFFDQHTRQEFDPASRDAGSIVKLFMIVCPSR
jgi:hypothetical protein